MSTRIVGIENFELEVESFSSEKAYLPSTECSYHKIAPSIHGPIKLLEIIGDFLLKIELPSSMQRAQNMVNESKLKPYE